MRTRDMKVGERYAWQDGDVVRRVTLIEKSVMLEGRPLGIWVQFAGYGRALWRTWPRQIIATWTDYCQL